MYLNSQSFEPSNHIRESAWLEHSPFVFWLVDTLRPSKMVELGTHNGFSFLSQCQVAKAIGLDTVIYAIDTWEGDEHAGFYTSEIYDNLEAEVRIQYPGIGRLIRSTFATARSEFEDGSVDLLHIDGRHRYDDVKEDFQTWVSCLSNKGIVLFHDTCVRHNDFGVYRYWQEVSRKYPSFEFYHGNGLGLIIVGKDAPGSIKNLCLESFENKSFIRHAYSKLGYINSIQFKLMSEISIRKKISSSINIKDNELKISSNKIHDMDNKISHLNAKIENDERIHNQQIIQMRNETEQLKSDLRAMQISKDDILSSTSWKITYPLRAIKSFFSRW
ncbi:MAG: class I SAM-dependent methyltransferase [Brucella anthropi]